MSEGPFRDSLDIYRENLRKRKDDAVRTRRKSQLLDLWKGDRTAPDDKPDSYKKGEGREPESGGYRRSDYQINRDSQYYASSKVPKRDKASEIMFETSPTYRGGQGSTTSIENQQAMKNVLEAGSTIRDFAVLKDPSEKAIVAKKSKKEIRDGKRYGRNSDQGSQYLP